MGSVDWEELDLGKVSISSTSEEVRDLISTPLDVVEDDD